MRGMGWLASALIIVSVSIAVGQDKEKAGEEKSDKPAAKAANGLETAKQKHSYAIGVDLGTNLAKADADLDLEVMLRGVKDAMSKGKLALSDEEMQAALTDFQKTLQAKAAARRKMAGDNAKKAGADFLAANAKKEGVETTKTGLQIRTINKGKGPKPTKADTVRVHYHGTFPDGKVFDSSVERKEPIEFPVTGVIPGWTEALLMMKVGDKVELVIPSDLAYGDGGTPDGTIPPHSVLKFEVELLGIVAAEGEDRPAKKGEK